MIAVLKHNTTAQQRDHLISWLQSQGLEVHISEGEEYTVLGLVGDTDKARVVVSVVLHRGGDDGKSVLRSARARGERGDVTSVALGNHLRCLCGVFHTGNFDVRTERGKKGRALTDRLLVGINFTDLGKSDPRFCQKIVVDLDADCAHNAEVAVHHQIVDLLDRACRTVFDGQNSNISFSISL